LKVFLTDELYKLWHEEESEIYNLSKQQLKSFFNGVQLFHASSSVEDLKTISYLQIIQNTKNEYHVVIEKNLKIVIDIKNKAKSEYLTCDVKHLLLP